MCSPPGAKIKDSRYKISHSYRGTCGNNKSVSQDRYSRSSDDDKICLRTLIGIMEASKDRYQRVPAII